MQLQDLIKPIDQLSTDELLERLRQVRHNREVARPVAAAKVARATKKSSVKKMSALEKLIEGMSETDRLRLIDTLGSGDATDSTGKG